LIVVSFLVDINDVKNAWSSGIFSFEVLINLDKTFQ